MRRRIAIDKLPRHPLTIFHRRVNSSEYVKGTFHCDVCDKAYPIRYMDQHHRTYKHQCNLLMLENVPRIHPSEVKNILKE